jgi:hypothetical protein
MLVWYRTGSALKLTEMNDFDWKINAKKALQHAAYAAGAILILAGVDIIGHVSYFMHPPGVYMLVPLQMGLKSLGNFFSQHT